MSYRIIGKDSQTGARAGVLTTSHGEINTPVFMPVGTVGSVKSVTQQELLNDIKASIILANTYHLYIRPGPLILKKAGGLHKFMNCQLPILTDSGGFQIYSLSPSRKLHDGGVEFTSYLDGSKHFFTPEKVIDIQRIIGADIFMPLDECVSYPCDYEYMKKSITNTHAWLVRKQKEHFTKMEKTGDGRMLFGIVQGGGYPQLREDSAKKVADLELDGNAIGGLSVGEPAEVMYEMTAITCAHLPAGKPRYLMGVGKPENMLESIALGIDMFDCVIPTRNGRNGWLFTNNGIINLRNSKWKDDFSPLDESGHALVDSYYSKGYVSHLHHAKEILGAVICSIHNLAFYTSLMSEARKHILYGDFYDWKKEMIIKVTNRL